MISLGRLLRFLRESEKEHRIWEERRGVLGELGRVEGREDVFGVYCMRI